MEIKNTGGTDMIPALLCFLFCPAKPCCVFEQYEVE